MRLLFAILLVAPACAVPIQNLPLSIHGLVPESSSQRPRPELGVIVESVSADNAVEHTDLIKHVTWSITSLSMGHEAGATGRGFVMPVGSSASELREDDVPLLPLPAFRIELRNDRDQPLPLDQLRFELDDGLGGSYTPLGNPEATATLVLNDLFSRHPALRDADQAETRARVRSSALALPSWSQPAPLEPHGHRVAWVGFRIVAANADAIGRLVSELKQLTLRVYGLTGEAPLLFVFTVAPRAHLIDCPDGAQVAHSRQCKRMEPLPLQPTARGPCIQHTRIKYSLAFTQWWMGSTAIANSDLSRTLLASAVSQRDAHSSDLLRGAGYGLLGGGILGAGAISATLAAKLGADKSYYGLSLLALVPVGVVLVYRAIIHGDRAVDSFNSASDDSGLCVPVW